MRDDLLLLEIARELATSHNQGRPYVPEAELAERMKVSRTHIREVLAAMDAYGMIEKRQKFGARLRPGGGADLRTIYDLRAMLESYAVAHAVERITDEDIQELELLNDMLEVGKLRKDYEFVRNHDLQFHHKLISIADVRVLSSMIRQVQLIKFSFTSFSPKDTDFPVDRNPWPHRRIIESLKTRSPESADIVRKHIEWSRDNNYAAGKAINWNKALFDSPSPAPAPKKTKKRA